ncbi:MAG: hypothetical protein AAB448_01090 [Patescibacteria group bacterium]|mgnify:FL=1
MKKIGETRASTVRGLDAKPRESWRMWVMTLLALGFAMLVITLLSKENKMLLADLQNAARIPLEVEEKADAEYVELPLIYSLEGVAAKVFVSTESFVDYTEKDLESMSNECGTVHEAGYFENLIEEFSGSEKIVYSFSSTEPSQQGNYRVTIIPNTPGYTRLEDFQKDFDICAVGGDMYPQMISEDWLMFTNSCGSGYDDGSGLPPGCDVMRQAIEPTLQLP